MPTELFPGLGDKNSSRIAILAQEYGLLLGAAEERISIGEATREAADVLNIAYGSPVTVLDRVVRTIDGRPVEWRVGQCNLATNYYLAQLP